MIKSNSKEERKAILDSISKHPNTRFAKLFHEVDGAPNQKNIVLLLMELVQQKDFYVDFNISLQYFLNLYEKLDAANKEFLFNEAGLLIHNATQIFCRRVDCLQQRMEDQLAVLSSGQESKEKNNEEETTPNVVTEKTKRRKRLVDKNDCSEIEVVSRKFRKIAPEKRFAVGTKLDTKKLFEQNLHAETYTHPALWQHAEIIDLDNDEDFDSKRNYRLFTSHLEHRYNTLVPDINFRLYFKMKDFMDEEDERDDNCEKCQSNDWPPLSQAYIRRYIDLEDQVLSNDKQGFGEKRRTRKCKDNDDTLCCNAVLKIQIDSCNNSKKTGEEISSICTENLEDVPEKDDTNCLEETNIFEETLSNSEEPIKTSDLLEESQVDSGIGSSLFQSSNSTNILIQEKSLELSTENISTDNENFKKEKKKSNHSEINDIDDSTKETNEKALNSNSEQVQLHIVTSTDVKQSINESIINDMADAAINSTMISDIGPTEIIEKPIHKGTDLVKNTIKEDETTLIFKPEDENNKQKYNEDSEDTLEIIVQLERDNNENCVSTDLCPSVSPSNDEGVYFSDIDDMPGTPYTIDVNLKTLNDKQNTENINSGDIFELPVEKKVIEWPININILEFPHNILRKMRKKCLLTNLGEDMELFLKSRCYKRTRVNCDDSPTHTRQIKVTRLLNIDSVSRHFETPPPSPLSDMDLLGFSEDGDPVMQNHIEKDENGFLADLSTKKDQNIRLSRDSGVGNELLTASSDKNTMFFPPITEEKEEKGEETEEEENKEGEEERGEEEEIGGEDEEVQRNIPENNKQNTGVQILENILLQAPSNALNTNTNNYNIDVDSESCSKIPITTTENLQSTEESLVLSTCETHANSQEATHSLEDSDMKFDDDNTTILGKNLSEIAKDSFDAETAPKINFPTYTDTTLNSDKNPLELTEDISTKIQKWHKHLQPMLANSHERHHFDVFQIGTNIMDKFSENKQESQHECITFKNVMEQQEQSYVSRFFLSTLLLANQGNIELKITNKEVSKPSEWHDVHLQLLSTTRHVVSMEDNIGMAAAKTVTPATIIKAYKSSEITTSGTTIASSHSKPAKKRCVSTLNVNLNRIALVKPIGKTPRTSDDYDSGIYSNDDLDNL